MPKWKMLQTRFTQGELDPLMIGRVDVDQYYGAASVLRNVFVLPQGGARRRFGLEYIGRILGQLTLGTPSAATAPNGGTAANGYDDNPANPVLTTTNLSTTTNYVVLRYDMGSQVAMGVVYLNGLKLSASGASSEFYVQVSTNDSTWVTVGDALSITDTAKDFSRRIHGTYRYIRLVRIGTTDLGTRRASIDDMLLYTEGALSNTKIITFEFNVSQTYVFVVSDKNMAIYQNGTYLIDLRQTNFTNARIPYLDWVQSADTLLVFHEDLQTLTFVRGSDNDIWTQDVVTYSNIPTYDFGGGAEAIWSVDRGWPRHGAFYQGRLFLDGGKSRPAIVYGSMVNLPFDFDFGTAQDDEAIGPLSFDGFNNIEAIYPGRNLMIMTSAGEYILPQPLGDPLTPSNVSVLRQSKMGSASYLRPQEQEGGVLYVQRGGKSIQEFIYDDTQQAFNNNFVSLLSSHLVQNPVDMALRRGTSTKDGAFLMMVLSDGTLTMATILRSQGITAFVSQTTDGSFKNCAADIEDMYFVIQRTFAGVDVQYLERFNEDHYLDSSALITTGLPEDTFTGLEHLNNKECRVLADGSVLQNVTPSGGSATIERDAQESVEIGINFNPTITDLPVENAQLGTVMGQPINISEIILRLDETAEVIVNDKTVSFRGFGSGSSSPLDAPPPQFTGVKRLYGWRGWTEGGQVTVTQENPLPLRLLSLAKRINV